MRKLLFGLCFLLTGLHANAEIKEVTILGAVKNLGNNELVLLNADQSVLIKTQAVDGKFKIITDLEIGDMRYYYLYAPSVGPLGPSMNIPTIAFFVCSPKIEVQAVLADKKMKISDIKGAPCNDEFTGILNSLPANKAIELALQPYNDAFKQYNEVDKSAENLENLKAAGNKLDQLYKERNQQMMALISTHPKSMPVAVMTSMYGMSNASVEEMEAFLKKFDPAVQHCYYLKQLKNKIDRLKSVAIGQQAPDFELKDMEGKAVKLSAFKGKYVLLDFWASWCGPCRKENPNVVKAYDQYKAKGFTVLGVSLDASEANWRKAVKEDGMPWVQTLDDKSLAGNVGKLYEIKAIPSNFLIDPRGKIIATNLRGNKLEQALENVIK